jgi:hypothetical protein
VQIPILPQVAYLANSNNHRLAVVSLVRRRILNSNSLLLVALDSVHHSLSNKMQAVDSHLDRTTHRTSQLVDCLVVVVALALRTHKQELQPVDSHSEEPITRLSHNQLQLDSVVLLEEDSPLVLVQPMPINQNQVDYLVRLLPLVLLLLVDLEHRRQRQVQQTTRLLPFRLEEVDSAVEHLLKRLQQLPQVDSLVVHSRRRPVNRLLDSPLEGPATMLVVPLVVCLEANRINKELVDLDRRREVDYSVLSLPREDCLELHNRPSHNSNLQRVDLALVRLIRPLPILVW